MATVDVILEPTERATTGCGAVRCRAVPGCRILVLLARPYDTCYDHVPVRWVHVLEGDETEAALGGEAERGAGQWVVRHAASTR